MALLPENPTEQQIEELFKIVRLKSSNSGLGNEMQKKYKRFDTTFGLKAVAYHQLLEYFNAQPHTK